MKIIGTFQGGQEAEFAKVTDGTISGRFSNAFRLDPKGNLIIDLIALPSTAGLLRIEDTDVRDHCSTVDRAGSG
jgi:hypothetical protein